MALRVVRLGSVILLAACRSAVPGAAGPAPAADPDAAPPAAGWIALFNGRDLAGWTVKAKPDDKEKDFWKVDGGTILADSMGHKGHDYVWLVSDGEYADFTLALKFQAYRDSPGNSGVQIRSRYDDAAYWLDGPQVDVHPPGPWRTGMIWDETRGNQRWLWPPVEKGKWVNEGMARPGRTWKYSEDGNGWNELVIVAKGTALRADLNGATVMAWDGAGVLDDETHRKRNVGLKGHIALQIHRGDRLRVRFKGVRIRPE